MFGNETAFRHFACGGVIFKRNWPKGTVYECGSCWQRSPDLLDLVLEDYMQPEEGWPAEQEAIEPDRT